MGRCIIFPPLFAYQQQPGNETQTEDISEPVTNSINAVVFGEEAGNFQYYQLERNNKFFYSIDANRHS